MWQPEEASLETLVELLNETQIPDDLKQKQIHQKIKELSTQPEFCNYLVYILGIKDNQKLNVVRKIAGATLKGILERLGDKIPNQNLDYVKIRLMETFDDTAVRNAVANSMTALLIKIGFNKWPELLHFFSSNLEQNNVDLVTSSLECIAKILEDLEMDSENFNYFEEKSDSPLGILIPKLILMCDSKYNSDIRSLALHSLNLFTSTMPPSFLANMNNYFQILFTYSQDENTIIKQHCCDGFIKILEKRKDLITAHLEPILERILRFTVDQNKEVKKKACLFWNEYLIFEENETSERLDALHKYLEFLIPALIDCLEYTEEDLLAFDSREAKIQNYCTFDDDNDEDGINKVHDDDNRDVGQATLRKEAGLALQALAMEFEDEAFYKSQTKLESCLSSDKWEIRETGILALGTIAKGAEEAIKAHFHALSQFLVSSLENNQPLVRSIACWTLSRFTKWIVELGRANEEDIKTYMIAILKLMMDDNFRAQEAACSALSKLCNEGTNFVESYLTEILEIIKNAADKYQQKETIKYLYDAIGSLVFNISKSVVQSESIEPVLMEIIAKKWNESQFNTTEDSCLVECTDSIISAIEKNSAKYAEFFIPRIMLSIYNYIQFKNVNEKNDPFYHREVAIRCFDLLDKFLTFMGSQIQQYVIPSDYQKVFHECVNDEDIILRQVTLSSVNHVANFCPDLLKEYLQPTAEVLLRNLYYAPKEIDSQGIYMGCCNNAAAAAGDFALVFPNEFINFIPEFAEKICEIFQGKLHKAVAQTLAITLGKFGLVSPDHMSLYLSRFLKQFCMSIGSINGDPNKEQAFRGLFAMVLKNPESIVKDFGFLCLSLVNFENVSQDLLELGGKILQEFKAYAGTSWNEYLGKFPPNVRSVLSQKFGV